MIYYLIQGEAYQYPLRMAEMHNSGAEVIFLTWDKQIEGALFLPNSTFAQGRDFLIQYVLSNNYNFEYLVLMDGDARAIKGNWHEFNKFLLKKKPQICVPLMPKSSGLLHRLLNFFYLPSVSYQRAIIFDEQVIAYQKDIITKAANLIHLRIFEATNWCYGGVVRLAIAKSLVPRIIQFNGLQVANDSMSHTYPRYWCIKEITNYINSLGLPQITRFEHLPKNKYLCKLVKLMYCLIELFFWFPLLPIKQYDINKNLSYTQKCIDKINKEDLS